MRANISMEVISKQSVEILKTFCECGLIASITPVAKFPNIMSVESEFVWIGYERNDYEFFVRLDSGSLVCVESVGDLKQIEDLIVPMGN